ncbi:TPA: helix-turn-helix domain-containing protein [Neisseria meningitidis]
MDLRDYCAIRGNQSDLARKTGISPSFIYQIAKGLKPVPIQSAALIEKSTNGRVTRKEMFPDTWHLIWPELAGDQTK